MATNLRERFEEFLKSSGQSQEGIAKALGISGAVLSSWRKEKYNGDNERIDNLIVSYLTRQENMAEISQGMKEDFDFVPTTVYENVIKGADVARLRHGIRVITGESGVGKTTALEHLKAEDESMILLRAYAGIRKNRVLAKLCREAGLSGRGSFDDCFEELVVRLSETNRLVAIDEAEHLPIDAVDAIRRLNDFARVPVVFVGLPKFIEILRTYQYEYAYVYNRISIPVNTEKLGVHDVDRLVRTVLDCDVAAEVWMDACGGIGRDLREVVLESLRIAKLNRITPGNNKKFLDLIARVKKELGRNII